MQNKFSIILIFAHNYFKISSFVTLTMKTYMTEINKKHPAECKNIAEVRCEIDAIDKAVIGLLGKRFDYVKEVVKYKENTSSSIEDAARRQIVIDTRREWAQDAGLNPDSIEEMYLNLTQYFINEEKKLKNI